MHDCRIDLRVTIAQGVGAYAHDGHVGVALAVEVPDFAAFGLRKIGGPLPWREHFCAFGQQHIAAGDHVFSALPQLLTGAHGGAFIAHDILVGAEEVRLLLLQFENVFPAEVNVGRKVSKHLADHLMVDCLVHGPSQMAQVLGTGQGTCCELLGLAQIGRHMLAVIGVAGFLTRLLERAAFEDFDVQPVWVGWRRAVA